MLDANLREKLMASLQSKNKSFIPLTVNELKNKLVSVEPINLKEREMTKRLKSLEKGNKNHVGHCSFWPTALTASTSDGDDLVTTGPLNSPVGIAKSAL